MGKMKREKKGKKWKQREIWNHGYSTRISPQIRNQCWLFCTSRVVENKPLTPPVNLLSRLSAGQ